MKAVVIGCGRVGSSVARAMLHEGHEVSCLDEDPESHARLEVGLDKGWEDLGGMFTVGAGIVEAARRSGVEAIVIGGEPPSKVRGGATLGGIGASKPDEIGAATEYVLKKAPCRVLLTAPPEAVDVAAEPPAEPAAERPAEPPAEPSAAPTLADEKP